jgi:diguanylate cyclase (GGDEF)-like protein
VTRIWRLLGPAAAILLGTAAVGVVDYLTGTEVRVLPLYFVPVGAAAWYFGRLGGVTAAALSALAWVGSNALGGLRYSNVSIWYVNTAVQFIAFAVVALLIATVRRGEVLQASLARLDPLTGLLNRRALYEIGARITSRCRRVGTPVAIAFVDLDHFKAINDSAGHEAGDRLLREIADRLVAAVRPTDIVARLGGDEFVLLMPDLRAGDADAALERVRAAVASVLTPWGAPVTASIGAAGFASPPDHLDGMVARADEVLYRAKSTGRNRAMFEQVETADPV